MYHLREYVCQAVVSGVLECLLRLGKVGIGRGSDLTEKRDEQEESCVQWAPPARAGTRA